MLFFGFTKTASSLFRWALNLFNLILPDKNYVVLTPPFFQRQFVLSKGSPLRVMRITARSYFDWATIIEVFSREEYSLRRFSHNADIQFFYDRILQSQRRPLIIDLGANVGISGLYFKVEYSASDLVAVEPSASNISSIADNLSTMDSVDIRHAAISCKAGRIDLVDPGLGNNAFRTFGKGSRVGSVEALTVEKILESYPNHELFLVKVDIEGFERELFSSNTEWIDRAKVISVETHDWLLPGEAVSQNLINSLAGRNRDLVFFGENLFSIRNDSHLDSYSN